MALWLTLKPATAEGIYPAIPPQKQQRTMR
jgi:hypothetical protein